VSAPQLERSPLDYTPKHLADRILRSKSALEGERKQVTVMFADVKGSMELAEQVDPEGWHQILDRFFQILSEGVHRFEGTVNQYTGDGIMALFGAPIAHEDHAQRACYAALHLKTRLREYADELRRTQGISFSTRIGINSGTVVVGKIGNDLRMDYTAQGQTVGLAQRMETLAEPGCAYLADETRRLVEGYFALRPLGEFAVKGVKEPVPVHELEGLGTQRTRLDRSRARGFSRFIGRGSELDTLEHALDQSLAGHGRVVGVVADAGTGKSRLCDEFIERCRGRELRVQAGHCPAHGQSMAFLPVLELLRGSFGIEESDSDLEARRKIAGELTLLDPSFQQLLPLLFEFLGVPDPARPAPPVDAAERERQLLGFVDHLVQARSDREPGIVFIDDLHWVDPGSETFVARLVDVAARTRTFVLVNFRPEYRAEWMQQSHYQQIPLDPLGAEEVQQLVIDLLGTHESLEGLGDHVYQRTGGNPFFVEEIVQSLVENGSLEGERGAYRLTGSIADVEIPPTVHAVLAARIDRLVERDKRLLQVASVIGRTVPEPLLADVAGLPAPELAGALASLQRGEFLLQQALYPEAEYLFKHALTLDVAYESQLAEPRAKLHAAVARAAEAHAGERVEEQSSLLARHWESAGDAHAAAHWHARASRWAGLTQSTQMLRHLHSAIELLQGVDPTPESRALEADSIREILGLAPRVGTAEAVGGFEGVAERAVELSKSTNDPTARAGLAHGVLNWKIFGRDDLEGAAELLDETISLADASGDPERRVGLCYSAGVLQWMRGDLASSTQHLEDGLGIALSHPELRPGFVGYDTGPALLSFLGIGKAMMGRCRESAVDVEQLIDRSRNSDAPTRVVAFSCASFVASYSGERDLALARGRRAIEICEPISARNIRGMAMGALGLSLAANEQWAEASEVLERLWSWSQTLRSQRGLTMRGRALLEVETPEAAIAAAEEVIAHNQAFGARFMEAEAHLDLAAVLARASVPQLQRIDEEIARAKALIEWTGGRILQPRIHEIRALLDPSARERELREAQRLYIEMGAAHADRIEQKLAS
jgi:class 3 adenylate cyclase